MNKYDKSVMAGIVLYNPDIKLLKNNIDTIVNQVDCMFLYDNASNNYGEIRLLLKEYPNIVYKRGEKNEGIAKGLNEILQYAESKSYEWYLTLDQDSICAANLVDEYRKFASNPEIGLICPVIMNNGKLTFEQYKEKYKTEFDYIEKPIDCITSACLNKTKLVKQIGGYPEDYFIDYVDVDLNCRVMQSGHKILRANKTYLTQHMGEGRKIKSFTKIYQVTKLDWFRRMQTATVYSDLRLYYSARNSLIVHRKYSNAGFRVSPVFMTLLFCYFTVTYPMNRSRVKMWKSIIKGFSDGRKYLRLN